MGIHENGERTPNPGTGGIMSKRTKLQKPFFWEDTGWSPPDTSLSPMFYKTVEPAIGSL